MARQRWLAALTTPVGRAGIRVTAKDVKRVTHATQACKSGRALALQGRVKRGKTSKKWSKHEHEVRSCPNPFCFWGVRIGKKTPRGVPGHTRDTRAHTGTRITQTNLTSSSQPTYAPARGYGVKLQRSVKVWSNHQQQTFPNAATSEGRTGCAPHKGQRTNPVPESAASKSSSSCLRGELHEGMRTRDHDCTAG